MIGRRLEIEGTRTETRKNTGHTVHPKKVKDRNSTENVIVQGHETRSCSPQVTRRKRKRERELGWGVVRL